MSHKFNLPWVCGVGLPLLLVMSGCQRDSDSAHSKPVVIEVITNATEIATAKKDGRSKGRTG